MRTLMLALLIALGTAACGHNEVRPVIEPLHRPERPVLPAITAHDVTCLSDDAYARLVARERLMREYAEKLEVIIDSTQPKAEKVRMLAI